VSTPELVFGDPETVAVSDLAAGDFIVRVPTQSGIAGRVVNSGIATLAPDWDTWTYGRGRARYPVAATAITFLSRDAAPLTVPDTFAVIARRVQP
jgi:hypothetical protein